VIEAEDFIGAAKSFGFNTWAGVPCSFLTPFINRVIDDPDMVYISAANEGDAVATATGAALAGCPAVAMMQNSGLGNAVSPLSSLNWVFRIPILLIITLRGEPGLPDEPQHELMGQITTKLLDQLQIPWTWFPRDPADVEGALTVASWNMERTARPYAFVMRKGSVAPTELNSRWRAGPPPRFDEEPVRHDPEAALLTRQQALREVVDKTDESNTVLIGTTGYTGRELFAIGDRPNQLYMVGSMGCASSLGLGLSLVLPTWRVVVLDGDGAALMRMGNIATAGAYAGDNFRHLLMDNAMHESTGGQSTVSSGVRFAIVARACGYPFASEGVHESDVNALMHAPAGPALLHLHIRPGVPDDLPRPAIRPLDVRRRLMAHLGITTGWSERSEFAG
jgi:phosphonopyruvate decarboxylase